MLTCSNSLHISIVRNPALANLFVERNWNTGNTISYKFTPGERNSSVGDSPSCLALAETDGNFSLVTVGCCPRNRTSKENPQMNWYSLLSISTIVCPDSKQSPEIFSTMLLEWLFPSKLTGTASSTRACKITGHDSSKQVWSFDDTRGDWIPLRNELHWK